MLDQRKIGIDETGSGYRGSGGGAELSACGRCETACVEPLGQRLTARLGIADLVWTVKAISVVFEVHSGFVVTVNNEHREPGSDFFNDGSFPSADDRIGGAMQTTSEPLACAKRELIDDAGRETVIEVDL